MAGSSAGKVALLTAAAAGIGRAIAEAFSNEGARVIATDLDVAELAGLDGDSASSTCRSTEAVEALAARGRARSTSSSTAPASSTTARSSIADAAWDFSFDLNVRSMHRMIKAFLPAMIEKGRGSIVNIASGASSIRGIPNRYVYGTTKAAVIGLTKAVAADFIRKGVRCNAIAPGTIESLRSTTGSTPAPRPPARARRSARLSSPASRWEGSASAEEVAARPSISRATRAPSAPARSSSSMADLQCRVVSGLAIKANKHPTSR